MKTVFRTLFVVLQLLGFSGCVQIPHVYLSTPIETAELSDHVRFLAQDALKGRKPRSSGSSYTREYIESRFKALGLAPWGESRGYSQPFGFGTNIVGVLQGSDEELADQIVLVCAHYDHVGTDKNGKVHPGASDNASGVAALLEIAEKLTLGGVRPRRSVCFAAFDCEETFLLGAFAFTCRDDFDKSKLAAVINIDVLGRKFFDVLDNAFFVIGTEDYPSLRKTISDAAREVDIQVLPVGTDLAGPSGDHVVFEPFQIPCLFFSCGMHGDYHKPTDTADRLDYSKMQRETSAIFRTVQGVANLDEIVPKVSRTKGDAEELRAVETVLTQLCEQWQTAGLTDEQRQEAQELIARIRRWGGKGNDSLRDRRQLTWDVQGLIHSSIIANMATRRSKADSREADVGRRVLRAALMYQRNHLIENVRQCISQVVNQSPSLFSGPVKSAITTWAVYGDVWLDDAGDDRFLFGAVISGCKVEIAVEATFLPPHSQGSFEYKMFFQPLGMLGTKLEIVDYLLLQWDQGRKGNETLSDILEEVTGEHDRKSYRDWLEYRLALSDYKSQKQWAGDLLNSNNGQLLFYVLLAAKKTAPDVLQDKLPDIIGNSDLPPDVRATAVSLLSEPTNKRVLFVLVELLGEEVEWKQCQSWNGLRALGPSHPIRNMPGISGVWEFFEKRFNEQKDSSRTLAKEAEDKLKQLTGQDFGRDAISWQRWIEAATLDGLYHAQED